EALKPLNVEHHILLTTEDSLKSLTPLADKVGFECFAGPKEDVLSRFILAADFYGVDSIVRATGDNPLVSGALAQQLLLEHLELQNHYSGYLGIPLGCGVEILDVKALKKAQEESDNPYDHEHVAPFLYKNPQRFKIHQRDLNRRWGDPGIKVSLDTREDLERITHIFKELYRNTPISIDELISYLKRSQP
nr:acylneuraminate cytidylyltransferase [Spirochaetaceae bacterium]